MRKKVIKSIKKYSIINISVYAVIVSCIFFILYPAQAQPIRETRVLGKRGDRGALQRSTDPFSLPSMLRLFLEEQEQKVQEEVARAQKKIETGQKSGVGKTDPSKAEGPEQPKEEVLPELPSMTMTGIIFSKDKPVAILNGEVLSAGETLQLKDGSLRVRSIEKNQVIVDFQEYAFLVSLEGAPKRLGRADEQGKKNVF